jgi:hypothetical protein
MLTNIISKIICDTYDKQFRYKTYSECCNEEITIPDYNTSKKPITVCSKCHKVCNTNGKIVVGMKVKFGLSIDYDKEDGYRSMELLLLWKGYVGVFKREYWDIEVKVSETDLSQNYKTKGNSPWECLSCHDSCWRYDGVQKFVFENREKLSYITSLINWYEPVILNEKENKVFGDIERKRVGSK